MRCRILMALSLLIIGLLGPRTTVAQEEVIPKFVMRTTYGALGSFAQCLGIGSENIVIEKKVLDAGGQEVIIKRPGPLVYLDVICLNGVLHNDELLNWRRLVEEGHVNEAIKTVFIESLDPTANVRWEVVNAWPRRLILSAEDSHYVSEIVLVHEGVRRISLPQEAE